MVSLVQVTILAFHTPSVGSDIVYDQAKDYATIFTVRLLRGIYTELFDND